MQQGPTDIRAILRRANKIINTRVQKTMPLTQQFMLKLKWQEHAEKLAQIKASDNIDPCKDVLEDSNEGKLFKSVVSKMGTLTAEGFHVPEPVKTMRGDEFIHKTLSWIMNDLTLSQSEKVTELRKFQRRLDELKSQIQSKEAKV